MRFSGQCSVEDLQIISDTPADKLISADWQEVDAHQQDPVAASFLRLKFVILTPNPVESKGQKL